MFLSYKAKIKGTCGTKVNTLNSTQIFKTTQSVKKINSDEPV